MTRVWRESATGVLTVGMSTRDVACVHFPDWREPHRIWQHDQNASQRQTKSSQGSLKPPHRACPPSWLSENSHLVHCDCTEVAWRYPEAHCCAIHPWSSPHVAAGWCMVPCCKDLHTIPGRFSMATGLQTLWTCHPLSMFEILWSGVCDIEFQFLPMCSSFTQPLKRSSTKHNQPHSLVLRHLQTTTTMQNSPFQWGSLL